MSTSTALPRSGLLALAMTGFIAIMTETLPAGLLTQIAVGMGFSPAVAGQLVTLYALGSLLAAIPLTALTRGWRRRKVLLASVIGFFIFNTLTAVSASVVLMLAARFLAGAAAGLAWGLIAGYARQMVPAYQQGKAMSLAMVGTPLALSLGLPLGTWLGDLLGWRLAFGGMSLLTLALIAWILLRVPDYPGQPAGQRKPLGQVFRLPGVRSILLVLTIWVLAHNLLYTYIVPMLQPAGLAVRADGVLLVFGCSALIGIWLTGLVVDRWLRRAVLLSIGGFALATLGLALAMVYAPLVIISVGLWGLTFGGAATLLQTALADATGPDGDVAQAMLVVAWNLAIAGGGLFGGILLQSSGVQILPWIALLLLLPSLLIAWRAQNHGIRPGVRVPSVC